MRKCIKCGRELPLGMFHDNWRHKVNVCKDCLLVYQRERKKINRELKKERQLRAMDKRISNLEKRLYGE